MALIEFDRTGLNVQVFPMVTLEINIITAWISSSVSGNHFCEWRVLMFVVSSYAVLAYQELWLSHFIAVYTVCYAVFK